MASDTPQPQSGRLRYGIGEWYGLSFAAMEPGQRKSLAEAQARRGVQQVCPWRSTSSEELPCTKKGGVCSLRLYEQKPHSNAVCPVPGINEGLAVTCPERFYEGWFIFEWIGDRVIGCPRPTVLGEIGFLQPIGGQGGSSSRPVGKIDHVLLDPDRSPLQWCALEMQAVYFSGAAMGQEFARLRHTDEPGIPFPTGHRRPDFRSSGPKRLMPQLQIKVPTLRRWGKTMTVVVDRAFFDAMAPMEEADDLSNADIAWFVLRYRDIAGRLRLELDDVRFTTLERAVEGLTAGLPVSLNTFEERILQKLDS